MSPAGAPARHTSLTCGSGPPLGYVPGQAMLGCCSQAYAYMGRLYSALPSSPTLVTYRAYCHAMKISSTGQWSLPHPLACSSALIGGLVVWIGKSTLAGLPAPNTSSQVPAVLDPLAAHTSRSSGASVSLCF